MRVLGRFLILMNTRFLTINCFSTFVNSFIHCGNSEGSRLFFEHMGGIFPCFKYLMQVWHMLNPSCIFSMCKISSSSSHSQYSSTACRSTRQFSKRHLGMSASMPGMLLWIIPGLWHPGDPNEHEQQAMGGGDTYP